MGGNVTTHFFYTGKCNFGNVCQNSHEFRKCDVLQPTKDYIIKSQAKEIQDLKNSFMEKDKMLEEILTNQTKPVQHSWADREEDDAANSPATGNINTDFKMMSHA